MQVLLVQKIVIINLFELKECLCYSEECFLLE